MNEYKDLFLNIYETAMVKLIKEKEKWGNGWKHSSIEQLRIRLDEHVKKTFDHWDMKETPLESFWDLLDIINYSFFICWRIQKMTGTIPLRADRENRLIGDFLADLKCLNPTYIMDLSNEDRKVVDYIWIKVLTEKWEAKLQ